MSEARITRNLFVKKAVVALALTLGVLASGVGAASATPVTIAKSGSYGTWYGEANNNFCHSDWYGGYIQLVSPYINRAQAYRTSTQVIWARTQVEYWTGGAWAVQNAGRWESRTTYASNGAPAFFSGASVAVPQGRYYRVVQFYEWWVGGRRVGSATNLFDQNDYSGSWVAQNGPGNASWCYVY